MNRNKRIELDEYGNNYIDEKEREFVFIFNTFRIVIPYKGK